MKYQIENLKINELEECIPIFIKAYSKFPYNEKWNERGALKRIKEIFEGNEAYCLSAKYNKRIVGFVLVRQYTWDDGTRIFVEDLVVDGGFSGNDLGKKLLVFLNDIAKKKNIYHLNAIVNKSSKAYPWLLRLGFTTTEYDYLEWKVK